MNIIISTYAELQEWTTRWVTARLPLVVITSRGGLGKSRAASKVLDGVEHLNFKGHVTPLQFYIDLYDNRDKPVLLNDIDQLLNNVLHVAVLKHLCDSEKVRTVKYDSTSKILEGRDRSFETSSPVMILANQFKQENPDLAALATRAIRLHFDPCCLEVLRYCDQYEDDKELIDFFATHATIFDRFTPRDLSQAKLLKATGADWQAIFMQSIDPRMSEVHTLMKTLPTEAQRIERFSGSRATYYRHKNRLTKRTYERSGTVIGKSKRKATE